MHDLKWVGKALLLANFQALTPINTANNSRLGIVVSEGTKWVFENIRSALQVLFDD